MIAEVLHEGPGCPPAPCGLAGLVDLVTSGEIFCEATVILANCKAFPYLWVMCYLAEFRDAPTFLPRGLWPPKVFFCELSLVCVPLVRVSLRHCFLCLHHLLLITSLPLSQESLFFVCPMLVLAFPFQLFPKLPPTLAVLCSARRRREGLCVRFVERQGSYDPLAYSQGQKIIVSDSSKLPSFTIFFFCALSRSFAAHTNAH